MSAWTCRHTDGKVVQKIDPPRPRIPYWKGLGADSEEKHEPASDIDTALMDSLKVLDPDGPIREADITKPSSLVRFVPKAVVRPELSDFTIRRGSGELSTRQKSEDRRVKRLRVLAVHAVGGIWYDDQLFHVVRQAEPHCSERLLETFWTLLAYDRQDGKSKFADRLAWKAWSRFGADRGYRVVQMD